MRQVDWHKWYAWYPVITDDTMRLAWLEPIERRKWFIGPRTAKLGLMHLMVWHYRELRKE